MEADVPGAPPPSNGDEADRPMEADPTTSADVPGVNRDRVLFITLCGVAASTFPVTVLSTAIPTIASDFGATTAVTQWVITAPLIALAVLTPMAGKLGDLHGHRRLYLAGFSAAAVLNLFTALAWSAPALAALRTLSQSASAATGPASMAILIHTFPREERARVLGLWASTIAISPTIGVLVGGPLVDRVGWRLIFLAASALSVVAVVVSRGALPETPRRQSVRFDVAGALTLGAAVGTLLFGINRMGAWHVTHPVALVCVGVTPALLVSFVRIEQRAEEPLVPIPLLRNHRFTAPLAAQFVLNGTYMGSLLVTPILLQRLFNYGNTARGLVTIPRPIGFALGASIGGRAEPRLGARTVVIVGTIIVTIGMVVQGLGAEWELVPLVLLSLFIAGLGNGYCRPAIATSVANAADDADAGVASASLNMVSQIGSAAGNTVYTALIGESADPSRFLFVFLVAAAVGLSAIALSFRLDRRPSTLPLATT